MENKRADAEYYRKAARVLHTLRYVVLLVLIVFVVIGFTTFKRELTYDNFRYIMRYLNFNISADYKDTNILNYSADEGSLYGYLKGDLAILSSKSFRTYDFSGSELIYEKHSFPNPCLKTAGKYALCYDVSGTSLRLYNSYANYETKHFDYGIKDACVRSDGSYAVSTSGKHLRSKVTVYEPNGEFTYETRDKEVVAVSLPENTDKVNFLALTVENGDFKFDLRSYNTRNESAVVEKEFIGEFPLRLYSTDKIMCVLTDRAIHFVDYTGKTLKQYSHSSDRLSGFYQSGDYIGVTYTRSVTRESTMRLFKTDGKEISSESFENNIISLSAYEDTVYALEQGKLHIINVIDGKIKKGDIRSVDVDAEFTDVFAISEKEYVLVSAHTAEHISE